MTEAKRKRLRRLSDNSGRFSMLAVDQRQSLRGMISEKTGVGKAKVSAEDLILIKSIVAETVAPLSSAILVDPIYGFPQALDGVEERGGVLVSAEITGYESVRGRERLSRLVDEWDATAWAESGIDGVKLLLWHHPGVSEVTRQHQESLVERVGEQCAEAGLPLLLEAKVYALHEPSSGVEWARVKPELVVDAAKTYAAPRFGVDLLKMDFPCELKYAEEFQEDAEVDWTADQAVYDLDAVRAYCQQLNEAAEMPWVILSAGVELEEFVANIKLANEAGASGFLCGRTVWKRIIDAFPDAARMREHMEQVGTKNFHTILAANDRALPWEQHRRYQTGA